MPLEILSPSDLIPIEDRLTQVEARLDAQPTQPASDTPWLCKAVGVNPANKSAAIGAVWKQIVWGSIDYDLFPTFLNDVRCIVRSGVGGPPSGNFVINKSGIYEFRAQIYVEPPTITGANLSVYLGLFDLGADGSEATMLHVSNENIPGGMHPAIKLEAPVKVSVAPGSQRYFAFRWYVLDGGQVTSSVNLQTSGWYCWADISRKCLLPS